MVAVSAFRSRVAGQAAGALDFDIDRAVLDACIEFCDKTQIIRLTLDSFQTTAGAAEYDIDAPAGSRLCQILRVWCDGVEIRPMQEDQAEGRGAFFSNPDGRSRPSAFAELSTGVLTLMPTPDKAYPVVMRVATKPSRSATSVDDKLFEDWAEVIAHGALARLLMQSDGTDTKPRNPAKAKAHAETFEAGIRAAMLEAVRGNTRGELRVETVRIK